MAKRRKSKSLDPRFIPVRVPLDKTSRALIGSPRYVLLAIANKLLNEPLIENTPEAHTVLDDRSPAEMIGRCQSLRPLWHGRA